MSKGRPTGFESRQTMKTTDFELFYYRDLTLSQVSPHAHDHYEFYLFLDGIVEYQAGGTEIKLRPGDFFLFPPGVKHQAVKVSPDKPYRRFILWISRELFESLKTQDPDGYGYGFLLAQSQHRYHFRPDPADAGELTGRLLSIQEERGSGHPFSARNLQLLICSFLVYVNRLVYSLENPAAPAYENALYLSICDYISQHLREELSLEQIAGFFFVTKYHIAHVFKESMGISIHQYILKKRLHACKNAILSGMASTKIYEQYGFHDYTVFYRAFKREYGLSPTEFKEQHSLERPTAGPPSGNASE